MLQGFVCPLHSFSSYSPDVKMAVIKDGRQELPEVAHLRAALEIILQFSGALKVRQDQATPSL